MPVTIEWMTEETSPSPQGGDLIEAQYGILEVDAIVTETYDLAAEVSEHPVEEGANISDHVRPSLNHITLEVAVSNQPIRAIGNHGATFRATELRLPSVTRITRGAQGRQRSQTETSAPSQGATVLRFDEESFDRVREVHDELERLMRSGTPIDIVGARFGDLENYLITGVSMPVSNDNGFTFTLDIQELRTAVTQEAAAPSPSVERGRRQGNRGRQNPTETTDGQRSESVLHNALLGDGGGTEGTRGVTAQ